ncbi:MAG: hypothetical protein RLZZ347_638 [Candidatus Parcubacteria bacterium]|jgi:hypothetical protein
MKPTHGDDLVVFDWGILPTREMPEADRFACPHCHKFSFFCAGNFLVFAALAWRASVVGFTTSLSRSRDVLGVATLQCGRCTRYFALPLVHEVVGAYQADCPRWPTAKNTQLLFEFFK